MALDIPSDQIYAGRYHYKNIEIPNILNNSDIQYNTDTRLVREEYPVDTVTFSDEGMEKSKDWREYTKDNPKFNRVNYEEQVEEFNRQSHTTNVIDPVSMFNCELGDVAEQIKSDNQLKEHMDSWGDSVTLLAKSYQVIYDRIEEEFADPDRETTYLYTKDGTYVEETKEDRINALKEAYNRRADFAAAGAKSLAEIEKYFGHANYSTDFINNIQDKVKEAYENAISDKNLERLRQKVTSFKNYSVDIGIDTKWQDAINSLLYKKH